MCVRDELMRVITYNILTLTPCFLLFRLSGTECFFFLSIELLSKMIICFETLGKETIQVREGMQN